MTTVLAFLLGNRVGRYIAFALMFSAIVALILWRVFTAGRNAALIDRKVKELEALKKKLEIDNEIASLPISVRRERLRRWVRNEG